MFLSIVFAVICFIFFLVAIACNYLVEKTRDAFIYLVFGFLFVILGGSIIFANFGQDVEVTTRVLSLYVPQDSKESETYYLEVTEDDCYKFCYFEDDGVTLSRLKVPMDGVEVTASNDDLPFRVEFYSKDGVLTSITLHVPEDSNTIQLDTDGK